MSPTPRTPKTLNDLIDSPEGLADRIAENLGCPVTIEDANHQIVSYSKHEERVDDARTATIMRRKVPESVVNGCGNTASWPAFLRVAGRSSSHRLKRSDSAAGSPFPSDIRRKSSVSYGPRPPN